MKDTEEGVQRYKLTNDIVIANTKRTIKVLTEKVLVATYTAGYPIEDFKKEYNIPESYVSVAPLILGYMGSKPKPPKRKEALIFSKK